MAESIETRIQAIEQRLDALEKSIPSADCIAREISEAVKKTMSGAEENAYDS